METELAELSENFDDDFTEEENFDFEEYEGKTQMLENRIHFLKNTMADLKEQIKLEKHLWKKEVEEFAKTKCIDTSEDQNESTNEPRLAIEPTLSDPSLLDYEKKLSIYHQALVKSHIEKRLQLRRHLIADAYKKRLLEIENMCNVELLKVKQSVQNLQPLQAIVSEWKLDDEITGGLKDKKDTEAKETESVTSDNKPSSEIKDILVYNSPTRSSFETTSSVLQEDEDNTLMMRRLQSMGWYNNEIHYLGYNPYM